MSKPRGICPGGVCPTFVEWHAHKHTHTKMLHRHPLALWFRLRWPPSHVTFKINVQTVPCCHREITTNTIVMPNNWTTIFVHRADTSFWFHVFHIARRSSILYTRSCWLIHSNELRPYTPTYAAPSPATNLPICIRLVTTLVSLWMTAQGTSCMMHFELSEWQFQKHIYRRAYIKPL